MRLIAVSIALAAIGISTPAAALQLLLSHGKDSGGLPMIGGIQPDAGDVWLYDTIADTASVVFDEDLVFGASRNLDAVHRLGNGNLVISFDGNDITLGSTTFDQADLIEFTLTGGGNATLVGHFLDLPSGTGNDTFDNTDSFGILPSGNLLVSLASARTINSTSFQRGDIIEIDPTNPTGTATLFLDNLVFNTSTGQLDAIHVFDATTIAISTGGANGIGGDTWGGGDVVKISVANPSSASFVESLFDGSSSFDTEPTTDIDAAFVVPEPGTAALLGLGLGGLGLAGRRRDP